MRINYYVTECRFGRPNRECRKTWSAGLEEYNVQEVVKESHNGLWIVLGWGHRKPLHS